MTNTGWGFDPKNIDKSVRPQDDFYHYAVGGWLKSHTIPPSESKWGSFYVLQHRTDTQLKGILAGLKKRARAAKGSPEQMVRDMYLSATEMRERARLGTKPIEKWRKLIREVADRETLFAAITALHKAGTGGLWDFMIDQDSKNTDRYLIHLAQGGLGMPDREYYLKNDPEQVRVRTAYVKHVARICILAGYGRAEAARATRAVMRIETLLARASMRKEELRVPEKTYHLYTLRKLERHAPRIDWRHYFRKTGALPRELIVMQPAFLKTVERMLASVSLDDWKWYLEWHLLNDSAGALTPAFEKANFDFYGTTLSGMKKMRPRWRIALSAINGTVGEQLGKIYVRKHFGSAAKRKVNSLVDDLVVAYEHRIRELAWMSPTTKKQSLKKLRAMRRKLGYPDKWRSYRGLVIHPDDYFGNLQRSHDFELRRALRKLGRPVDRVEWFIYPQLVNAFYSPTLNDILFPAGILQHPFFDLGADDALNYAGMGSVIGHELTHGFDDEGSKFDAKGNLKNWWTKADRKKFEQRADRVRRQYDRFVVEGLHVNGKLTLGENIADLGGLVIAYDAYMRHLKRTGRKKIANFSPEERFFLSYAQIECTLARPEVTKLRILTDPHSPAICRVNGPVSNIPEFYETFGVKKGDKLYRAPKDRAEIW